MRISESVIMLMLLTGCTYSMNIQQSSGKSSETLEETQSPVNEPDISPNITIPIKGLG